MSNVCFHCGASLVVREVDYEEGKEIQVCPCCGETKKEIPIP